MKYLYILKGEYYVPVRPNRGCFEAANERILTILKIYHNLKVFRVLLVKKKFTKLLHSLFNMASKQTAEASKLLFFAHGRLLFMLKAWILRDQWTVPTSKSVRQLFFSILGVWGIFKALKRILPSVFLMRQPQLRPQMQPPSCIRQPKCCGQLGIVVRLY